MIEGETRTLSYIDSIQEERNMIEYNKITVSIEGSMGTKKSSFSDQQANRSNEVEAISKNKASSTGD